jgi:tRNA (mo5U34)-methyltransferase
MSTHPKNAEIDQLGPWFHNLHFPDGTQTAPHHPLGDFPSVKWRQIAPFLPQSLAGYDVLDIGCNAGFYSFELARRGARVTAIDIDPLYLRQARWAAEHYGLSDRITFQQGSVYSLARTTKQYDVIWFLGVLYHLRHPLLALDLLREITRGTLFLQTMTCPSNGRNNAPENISLEERELMTRPSWPHMAFIEHSVENDPTNWWAPTSSCVEAMVRAAGFVVAARPGHEMYICEPDRNERRFNVDSRRGELQALELRP